ncbi:MAG TPA: hypothetical protein VHW65_02165 [Gemmatimonadales bacterium]|jgi:hypothetical protein|nr:hypothetical protein [Gemmatimonadales bacterium]
MTTWIGLIALGALLIWLLGVGKRRDVPASEDDVDTPVDLDELEAAERAVKDDPDAKAAADAVDDDDEDWGPGSGHSPIPGVL